MDFDKLKDQSQQFDDAMSGVLPVEMVDSEVSHAIALICYNMAEKILQKPKSERKDWVKKLPKEWQMPVVEIAKAIKQ